MTESAHLDAAAENLWRRTLSQIPSCFGQLAYLASLRNPHTREYEHHGFTDRFGAAAAGEVIRQSHQRVLLEWMSVDLETAQKDLEQYLDSLGKPRSITLSTWLKLREFEQFTPADTAPALRAHFLRQVQWLIELLSPAAGVDATDPDDLPRQPPAR